MTRKSLAQKVRNALGPHIECYKVVLTPQLQVKITPRGRRREEVRRSHEHFTYLVSNVIPLLRQRRINAKIEAYSTVEPAPIDVQIIG